MASKKPQAQTVLTLTHDVPELTVKETVVDVVAKLGRAQTVQTPTLEEVPGFILVTASNGATVVVNVSHIVSAHEATVSRAPKGPAPLPGQAKQD